MHFFKEIKALIILRKFLKGLFLVNNALRRNSMYMPSFQVISKNTTSIITISCVIIYYVKNSTHSKCSSHKAAKKENWLISNSTFQLLLTNWKSLIQRLTDQLKNKWLFLRDWLTYWLAPQVSWLIDWLANRLTDYNAC